MARIWIAVIIGLLAIVDDVTRRRISNWIVIAALGSGLILQFFEHGWRGGLAGLLGAAAGAGVFLIFYLMGGMGGGDVKLMAGFGALLGWQGILEAALWTAACGGIMAVVAILFGAIRKSRRDRSENRGPKGTTSLQSIPYAPAIAMGVWLSLIPKV